MINRFSAPSFGVLKLASAFLCLIFVAVVGFLSGCGHKYEDEKTGITVRDLGSDLDNHWAFRGVVVELVKPGSPADQRIRAGELISYIVDERQVTKEKDYKNDLSEALKEDDKAMLRILKVIPATGAAGAFAFGIRVKPDPEERGVIVDSVEPNSEAEKSGIKSGTIIYSVNGKDTRSLDDYSRVLAEAVPGSQALEKHEQRVLGASAPRGEVTLDIAREIIAPRLSKVGIDEIKDQANGVLVVKMEEKKAEGTPASKEGIKAGDVITHVIDEMETTDIDSYKKAIKKAMDGADRIIFKRGELGGVKLIAVNALGQIGDVKAIEPLLKALESNDRWIRRSAAGALERMDDARIIQPLMWHLLEENEPDPDVRRSAAIALARMRPMEAIEPLAQALKDSTLGVRLEAGYALGRIGAPAVSTLIKARYDADSRVRDSAVAALGNIGGKSVRDELISVLRDENEVSTVKLTAIQALSKIGGPESMNELRRIAKTGDPELVAFVKELLAEEVL